MARHRPVVLCILDGWGLAPRGPGNAIALARTPRLDALFASYPHAKLDASGRAVGLPDGVMGNSEVGHLTMGAGYVEYQDLVRINDAIADGSFFKNDSLCAAARAVRERGTLHLMGLLSTGGVHADLAHLNALFALAKREGATRVVYHAFLDGRDMPPRSAIDLLPKAAGTIATVQGRYWAMDRDKRWDRTERAWKAIVDAAAPSVAGAVDAPSESYAKGVGDELMEPRIVGRGAKVEDGDAVVFINFRPDRARQLTWAFTKPGFDGFAIARRPHVEPFVTMTDYKVDVPSVRVAFPPQEIVPMAATLADAGLKQFHTAETEKYAHVTYFFNGGREAPYPGEERELVPSAKVATYDLKPEMSAPGVATAAAKAIASGTFDFVVVNFANPDMVGHTGDVEATERAMVATDSAVGEVVDATLAADGAMLLTADHGNAEEMRFPDGGPNTQHSTNPVPVILIAKDAQAYRVRDGGLRDVAPTVLDLMGRPAPVRMTGRSLLARP